MNKLEPVVYIIDDESIILDSLTWIIGTIDLKVKSYTNGQHFLDEYNSKQPGCLLLDVRMPNMSGLEVQKILKEKGEPTIPIIFMSGYDDILLAVQVIKDGALDFMIKPLNEHILLENINKAINIDKINREKFKNIEKIKSKFMNLSLREKQILQGIVDGKPNKIISSDIQISLKTVEAHRASLMKKMEVKSVSKLIKLFFSVEGISY